MNQPSKKCVQCGESFLKSPSVSKEGWLKVSFCSKACHYASKRFLIACKVCGNEFSVKMCHKDVLKTCSKACRFSLRSSTAKQRQKDDPRFAAPKAGSEKAKNLSRSVKLAYANGKMDHMKKVWKAGEKRWTGEGNPRYRHGNKNGYKMIKIDGKWKEEHRAIMEKHIGRKLKKTEVVHHVNHDKHDNRLENLQVMTIAKHVSHHQKGVAEKK